MKKNPYAIPNAIEGAALAPLGAAERRELAILARRAWEKIGRPGPCFDAWRHQQTMICAERPGLTHCRREDYNFVKGHLLRLLGAERGAASCEVRGATEPRRQALAKLRAECAAARGVLGHPEAYVEAIAKAKFKTVDIERELAANQIWQLIFSLRNAAARKRRPGGKERR
jgi:hypothetical protein